jgi:uncharacterized membrane protein YsdA (DUF1294 family)
MPQNAQLTWIAIGFAYVLAINIVTFMMFWNDKKAAILGQWRTPEGQLLFFALLGGWPGAKYAQILLRHKTTKEPFRTRLNRIPFYQVAFLLVIGTSGGRTAVASIFDVLAGEPRPQYATERNDEPTMPRRFGPGS